MLRSSGRLRRTLRRAALHPRRVGAVALASALGSLAPLAVPAPLGLGVDLSAQAADRADTTLDYSTVAQTQAVFGSPLATTPAARPVAGGARAQVVPAAFLNPTAIPAAALSAYRASAAAMAVEHPSCNLTWQVLAGIGYVESGHARDGGSGTAGWSGLAQPAIYGPVLDGSSGAAIPDTDHGALDGDPTWDRAVGPMQFLPSTWIAYASDGNGDGVADPQQISDAALTAASFLCSRGTDLSSPESLASALFAYNHAGWYVSQVLAAARAYGASGALVLPAVGAPTSTNDAVPGLPSPVVAAPTVIGNPPARSTTGGVVGAVLTYAYAQLGTPYVWGGTSEAGFDCSGLTQASYEAAGLALPRTADQQWHALTKVSPAELQPGDLVFFSNGSLGPGVASHVGIYLGNGYMLDAPHTGAVVRIEPVYDMAGYLGGARPAGVPQLPDSSPAVGHGPTPDAGDQGHSKGAGNDGSDAGKTGTGNGNSATGAGKGGSDSGAAGKGGSTAGGSPASGASGTPASGKPGSTGSPAPSGTPTDTTAGPGKPSGHGGQGGPGGTGSTGSSNGSNGSGNSGSGNGSTGTGSVGNGSVGSGSAGSGSTGSTGTGSATSGGTGTPSSDPTPTPTSDTTAPSSGSSGTSGSSSSGAATGDPTESAPSSTTGSDASAPATGGSPSSSTSASPAAPQWQLAIADLAPIALDTTTSDALTTSTDPSPAATLTLTEVPAALLASDAQASLEGKQLVLTDGTSKHTYVIDTVQSGTGTAATGKVVITFVTAGDTAKTVTLVAAAS